MNINSIRMNNASFGKINWGDPKQAKKTADALIALKEANDVYGRNILKYTDVRAQLQTLSEHADTFDVKCSILDEYNKSSFEMSVSEHDTKDLLGKFERCFVIDKAKKEIDNSANTDINSFASRIINKHQINSIKRDVQNMMNQFGKTE